MPVSSFHPATQKYLTDFGPDARAGDTFTISLGCLDPEREPGSYRGCEFTTYVLNEPVAHDERRGHPLFDLDACAAFYPPTGKALPRERA